MRQPGLFGLADHLKRLSAVGDPLETMERVMDFGMTVTVHQIHETRPGHPATSHSPSPRSPRGERVLVLVELFQRPPHLAPSRPLANLPR